MKISPDNFSRTEPVASISVSLTGDVAGNMYNAIARLGDARQRGILPESTEITSINEDLVTVRVTGRTRDDIEAKLGGSTLGQLVQGELKRFGLASIVQETEKVASL